MIASLEGGSFSSIVQISFDSEGFEESTAIFIMEGVLFLPFAVLFDCFLSLMFKIPRVLSGRVIGIRINYDIKEAFLQAFLEEFYGANVIEWESSISGKLFKITDVSVKVVLVFQSSDFSLCIFGFVGIGEGLSEVCFEKVPKLFIVIMEASVNSGIEEV